MFPQKMDVIQNAKDSKQGVATKRLGGGKCLVSKSNIVI
jgi:hypothetical protein